MWRRLSRLAKDRGDYVLAEGLAREAASMSDETLGTMHPDSLRASVNLAAVLARAEKLDEAESAARDAVERSKLVYGERHADTELAESCLREVLHARERQ